MRRPEPDPRALVAQANDLLARFSWRQWHADGGICAYQPADLIEKLASALTVALDARDEELERLREALKEIEQHHIAQNALKGRPEERSLTLRIARRALTPRTPMPEPLSDLAGVHTKPKECACPWRKCKRRATHGPYCWQHERMISSPRWPREDYSHAPYDG